ncbi:MAG TPA: hypothetical protein VJA18_05950 [Candidatus Nanoarchaeia archaeon]|nr:hypothetical protein [Candidatus Nanoarchaeia archaeon]
MEGIIPDFVIAKLLEIITLKSQRKEGDVIPNIAELDCHIEGFLEGNLEVPSERSSVPLDELNKELRRIVCHF